MAEAIPPRAHPEPDPATMPEIGHGAPPDFRSPGTVGHPVYTGLRHDTPPRSVADQIADAARSTASGRVELVLEPEELGRLQMTLKSDGQSLSMTVFADRSDTLDLLRRHAHDLARALSEAGYDDVDLSFGQNRPQQHPATHQVNDTPGGTEDREDAAAADTAIPPAASPNEAIAPAAQAGMDIRL
ncbi:flagellar hook-length control protein FliK [Oceanicola sp. 22II-s10i]|uniref:flagellar hook-length control protein FliK n=1 Tax=Oceanicola sp. 22II-s10i TaxID=1317116 RepID=UPI00159545E0|nr:flagellar hook-length control protein FliK [Oceanicola sp. 22II-s10i]